MTTNYAPSLAPLEVASGWVFGVSEPAPRFRDPTCSPRAALEQVLLPALSHPPCYVSFSGGRDSSAVLAVAALLAQREGLDPPIPVTEVYPDYPETDESYWQQLVIGRLPTSDWVRIDIRGENDLLGDPAKEGLLSRGLLWPPAVQTKAHVFARLRGGTMLTGEGGDEIYGVRRIRPLARLIHRDEPIRVSTLFAAAGAAAPARIRARRLSDELVPPHPWLRPDARQEYRQLLLRDLTSEPLTWPDSLLWLTRRRAYSTFMRSHQLMASEFGVTVMDPLLDPRYLLALGSAVGRFGYSSRTDAMRAQFRDVLPDEILARIGKASFTAPHWGPGVQEFVQSWDGTGVDTGLVDPEALRREWLSDMPSPGSKTLVQAAWLNSARQTTPAPAREA